MIMNRWEVTLALCAGTEEFFFSTLIQLQTNSCSLRWCVETNRQGHFTHSHTSCVYDPETCINKF